MKISYIIILFILLTSCASDEDVSENLAKEYLSIGKEALANKDVAQAIKSMELASFYSEEGPMYQGIRYNLAYSYYYASDYNKALDILSKLNKSANALWLAGISKFYLKDYTEALRFLKQAQDIATPNSQIHFDIQVAIAYVYMEKGDLEEAENRFSTLAAIPEKATYQLYLDYGYLKILKEEYQSAIALLNKAGEIKKDAPKVNINLAEAYLKMGKNSQARTLIDDVLTHPDLTIRESDMAHAVDLELKGVDASYYRQKLEEPDKFAEITKVKAENGMNAAHAEIKHLNQQQEANFRQTTLLILCGVIIALALFIAYHMIRYRREQRKLAKGMENMVAILSQPIQD